MSVSPIGRNTLLAVCQANLQVAQGLGFQERRERRLKLARIVYLEHAERGAEGVKAPQNQDGPAKRLRGDVEPRHPPQGGKNGGVKGHLPHSGRKRVGRRMQHSEGDDDHRRHRPGLQPERSPSAGNDHQTQQADAKRCAAKHDPKRPQGGDQQGELAADQNEQYGKQPPLRGSGGAAILDGEKGLSPGETASGGEGGQDGSSKESMCDANLLLGRHDETAKVLRGGRSRTDRLAATLQCVVAALRQHRQGPFGGLASLPESAPRATPGTASADAIAGKRGLPPPPRFQNLRRRSSHASAAREAPRRGDPASPDAPGLRQGGPPARRRGNENCVPPAVSIGKSASALPAAACNTVTRSSAFANRTLALRMCACKRGKDQPRRPGLMRRRSEGRSG